GQPIHDWMDLSGTVRDDDHASVYGVALYEERYARTFGWKTFQRARPGTAVILRAENTISYSGHNQLAARRHLPDRGSGFEITDCLCPLGGFRCLAAVDATWIVTHDERTTSGSEHERFDVPRFGPALFVLAPGVETFGVQSGENR